MTRLIAWAAEEAAINGFPPMRAVICDGWMLRFSGGGRRTANSVTPLREPSDDLGPVIAAAETLYRGEGQPTIFRLPSFLAPAVDRAFAARGYTEEGASCVIEGLLDPIVAAASSAAEAVQLTPRPTDDWFDAMAMLQGHSAEYRPLYRRTVSLVTLPAAFAVLRIDGAPVALAYAIIHRGLLCYESVVTHAEHRRKGYSRRVLAALADWGKRNGATMATLQVEAQNTAGRTLYNAIGMTTDLHRYHYRRAPV
jgi:GNAT superfamily N-acetyltransferase